MHPKNITKQNMTGVRLPQNSLTVSKQVKPRTNQRKTRSLIKAGHQNKMPPPRPGKLNISTPKCPQQKVNSPNKTNINMNPTEIKQYCEWVSEATIKPYSKVQEVSLVQENTIVSPSHTAYNSAGYILKAIKDLITYLQAAAGYSIKQTWVRAIKHGHYIGWPGLTAE